MKRYVGSTIWIVLIFSLYVMTLYAQPDGNGSGPGYAVSTAVIQTTAGSYNVKNYGAKGDGVTNDSVSVQNAITAAAAAGGRVYFPSGTFLLSAGSISINSPIEVSGAGGGASYLKLAAAGTGTFITVKSNNTDTSTAAKRTALKAPYLHDLTVQWADSSNPTAGAGIYVLDTSSVQFHFRIERVQVIGFWDALVLQDQAMATVQDCDFKEFRNSGIRLICALSDNDMGDSKISRCYFGLDSVGGTSADVAGVLWEGGSGHTITDCKFWDVVDGVYINLDTNSSGGGGVASTGGLIRGCYFDGTTNGVKLNSAYVGSGSLAANNIRNEMYDLTIEGNRFFNNTALVISAPISCFNNVAFLSNHGRAATGISVGTTAYVNGITATNNDFYAAGGLPKFWAAGDTTHVSNWSNEINYEGGYAQYDDLFPLLARNYSDRVVNVFGSLGITSNGTAAGYSYFVPAGLLELKATGNAQNANMYLTSAGTNGRSWLWESIAHNNGNVSTYGDGALILSDETDGKLGGVWNSSGNPIFTNIPSSSSVTGALTTAGGDTAVKKH